MSFEAKHCKTKRGAAEYGEKEESFCENQISAGLGLTSIYIYIAKLSV